MLVVQESRSASGQFDSSSDIRTPARELLEQMSVRLSSAGAVFDSQHGTMGELGIVGDAVSFAQALARPIDACEGVRIVQPYTLNDGIGFALELLGRGMNSWLVPGKDPANDSVAVFRSPVVLDVRSEDRCECGFSIGCRYTRDAFNELVSTDNHLSLLAQHLYRAAGNFIQAEHRWALCSGDLPEFQIAELKRLGDLRGDDSYSFSAKVHMGPLELPGSVNLSLWRSFEGIITADACAA